MHYFSASHSIGSYFKLLQISGRIQCPRNQQNVLIGSICLRPTIRKDSPTLLHTVLQIRIQPPFQEQCILFSKPRSKHYGLINPHYRMCKLFLFYIFWKSIKFIIFTRVKIIKLVARNNLKQLQEVYTTVKMQILSCADY